MQLQTILEKNSTDDVDSNQGPRDCVVHCPSYPSVTRNLYDIHNYKIIRKVRTLSLVNSFV